MDILKNGLGPGGIGLLSDECTSTYLDDFNLLDVECGKGPFYKYDITEILYLNI